jgi:hypothetical protein
VADQSISLKVRAEKTSVMWVCQGRFVRSISSFCLIAMNLWNSFSNGATNTKYNAMADRVISR